MKRPSFLIVAAACAAVGLSASTLRAADEFGDRTPYYEDDAWWDITEWFDGNDYNPTDEAIGRWDDEVWNFSDNLTSTDVDSDHFYGDYGYYDRTSAGDRWYYDYYDDFWNQYYDFDRDGDFDQLVMYFDNNDDGLYDAYSHYTDTNNDGSFDTYNYYSFASNKPNPKTAGKGAEPKIGKKDTSDGKQQAASLMKQSQLRQQKVSGTIQSAKTVDVRGAKHKLAQVKTSDGQMIAVDLGAGAKNASQNAKIEASGPQVKIGGKPLIVAQSAKINDQQLQIDRTGRQFQGKVESTREVTVRGQKHLLVKVTADSGKKFLADLGPVGTLSSKPSQGQQVKIEGAPVKMQDRVMLMARSITRNGQTEQIQRRGGEAGSARVDD